MPEDYQANEAIEIAKTQMSKITLDSYHNVEQMDKNWVKGNFGELTKVVVPRLVKMLNTVHHRVQAVGIGRGRRSFFGFYILSIFQNPKNSNFSKIFTNCLPTPTVHTLMQNPATALALSQSIELVPALLSPYAGADDNELNDGQVEQQKICSVIHLMSQKQETSIKIIQGHAAFGVVKLLEVVQLKTKSYVLHAIYNILRNDVTGVGRV